MTTSGQDLNALVQTGMVGAMTIGIFASALGMMTATAVTMPIAAGIKATDAGINDMKMAFGADIVIKAVKNVGSGDIIMLATEVERLVIADMRKKYGNQNADTAIAAAPPGDLRAARAIAQALAGQGITPTTPPVKAEKALDVAKKRGKQASQPVKDTKTGTIYPAKNKAGMAVAAEYGLSAFKPDGSPNTFIWYEVIKEDPKRFVPTRL